MTTSPAPHGAPISIPQLLARNSANMGAKPAYREKEFGIWQTWTWAEAEAEIDALAMGMIAIGLNEPTVVRLLADNVGVVGR